MHKKILAEYEAEDFLIKYGIPVSKRFLIHSYEELMRVVKNMKFPVDLKIISIDVLHKSDVGGIRICHHMDHIIREYKEIMNIVKRLKIKNFEGIEAQEYVVGKELLIGLKKDETFGHVIAFGFGGIFTEVVKDVNFRVCPIDDKEAEKLINEVKAKEILYGIRGQKPVNFNLLKNVLVKISRIPLEHDNLIELDINPFVMNDGYGKAVDARIVFEE